MAVERPQRQKQMLAGLLVVLALVVLWQWWNWDSPGDVDVAGAPAVPAAARRTGQQPSAAFEGDINLKALEQPRPAPTSGGRNPFQFQAQAPAPAAKTPQIARKPAGPPAPKGPPPIALKFIGTLFKEGWPSKVAVLSDGKHVFHGKPGEIIDGRFRIVQIGEESMQLEYVNGQGRQVIRLTGK